MQIDIVAPNKVLYSGEAYLIQVPGVLGCFEILHNHAAILSSLESGRIKVITHSGEEHFFYIKNGFVECKNNKINVIVNT